MLSRRCIGCYATVTKSQLWRFVKTSNGFVVFDYYCSLEKKGAYTCKRLECLYYSIIKKTFDKVFKESIFRINIPLTGEFLYEKNTNT